MNKTFALLDSRQKSQSIFLILLMFFASILELLGLGSILMVINDFLNLESNSIVQRYVFDYFKNFGNIDYFNLLFLLILIIYSFKFILMIFVSWFEAKFLTNLRKKLAENLYKNFLFRSPSEVLKKNSAVYLRNFTEEISASIVFYNGVLKIILDSLLTIALLSFLVTFNAKVTIFVGLFFGLISSIYYFAFNKRLFKWAKKSLENRKNRIKFVNESFLAIKYIKILSAENYFLKKFSQQNKSLSEIMFKQNFIASLPKNILEYLLLISIIILLYFFKNSNYENEKITQILSIFTLVSFRLIPMMNRFLVSSQHIRSNYPSVEKLYFESNKKLIKNYENYKPVNIKKNVRIKFSYFSHISGKIKKNNFYLKNVDLIFKKNSKIGLIGPSGSGKSTIIDIVSGFLKLQNKLSPIQVDGKNIKNNSNGWQKIIGYVPQNTVILNGSLRENILFGSNKINFNDKKILNIISKVQLNNFLKKLNGNLSHIISQDGINISGGEKQRIGIARALLHEPELIILDEATSGLDSFTENKILSMVKKLNKIVFIVTHRTNSLRICDKIYKIENNTIKDLNKNNLN